MSNHYIVLYFKASGRTTGSCYDLPSAGPGSILPAAITVVRFDIELFSKHYVNIVSPEVKNVIARGRRNSKQKAPAVSRRGRRLFLQGSDHSWLSIQAFMAGAGLKPMLEPVTFPFFRKRTVGTLAIPSLIASS